MNTNNGVKWRRFIVPKKLNKLMITYSLTSQITYKLTWMKWRWMIAKCVWDEKTKLGQYRRYQSWDSLTWWNPRTIGLSPLLAVADDSCGMSAIVNKRICIVLYYNVDVVYIDFSRAFDIIVGLFSKLLANPEHYGILVNYWILCVRLYKTENNILP